MNDKTVRYNGFNGHKVIAMNVKGGFEWYIIIEGYGLIVFANNLQ